VTALLWQSLDYPVRIVFALIAIMITGVGAHGLFERVFARRLRRAAHVFPLPQDLPADMLRLGLPVAVHQSRGPLAALTQVVMGLLFMAAGGMALLAVVRGNRDSQVWSFAGIGLLVGAIYPVVGVRNLLSRIQVLVLEHGLVVWQGGRPELVTWGGLAAVYRDQLHTGFFRGFTLVAADGREVVLRESRLPNVESLCRLIEHHTTDVQLPRLRATLEQGGTVEFGPLTVDPHGITVHGRHLPWEDCALFAHGNGRFDIFLPSGQMWQYLPLHTVPNVTLLGAVGALYDSAEPAEHFEPL
jgi:hypothetical protein